MSTAVRILHGRFGRAALLDMDAPLVAHAHHHCHVLVKTGGAPAAFWVRDRLHPLTDEAAVLVNAWEPHRYHHLGQAARTTILALYIEPGWLAAVDRGLRGSAHPRFFPEAGVRVTTAMRRAADRLVGLMTHEAAPSRATVEDSLFALMVAAIDGASDWRGVRGEVRAVPPYYDYRIRRVIAVMGEDGGRHSLAALARAAGLSRAHFFQRFRETTGLTPAVFRNTLRVEAGITRLIEGEAHIGAIAETLGFAAQGNFTRFFRQHVGVTPREFRARTDAYGMGDARAH